MSPRTYPISASYLADLGPELIWVGAIAVVLLLVVREVERRGRDGMLAFWAGVAGLLGAWFGGYWYGLLAEPSVLLDRPELLLRPHEGAKALFGALPGAAAGAFGVLWYGREPVLPYADAAVPPVALGYAVYRIGCLWNGCEVGAPLDLAWMGLDEVGGGTHPVAAYHGVLGLAIYLRFRSVFSGGGRVFFSGLMAYGLGRFFLEFVRIEPVSWMGLHPGHWLSLLTLGVGLLGWYVIGARSPAEVYSGTDDLRGHPASPPMSS